MDEKMEHAINTVSEVFRRFISLGHSETQARMLTELIVRAAVSRESPAIARAWAPPDEGGRP